MRNLLLALPLLVLTACKGGGDPVEQALREEAAEHHAEAAFAGQQANSTVTEPDFAPSTSGDISTGPSVEQQIVAHETAIAQSELILSQTSDPEIRRLAESAIRSHTTAIAELRAGLTAK